MVWFKEPVVWFGGRGSNRGACSVKGGNHDLNRGVRNMVSRDIHVTSF